MRACARARARASAAAAASGTRRAGRGGPVCLVAPTLDPRDVDAATHVRSRTSTSESGSTSATVLPEWAHLQRMLTMRMRGALRASASVRMLLLFTTSCSSRRELATALDNGVARTPPMGWNSWGHFRYGPSAQILRAQADAMVRLGPVL